MATARAHTTATTVLLLRSINIGGRRIRMDVLRELAEAAYSHSDPNTSSSSSSGAQTKRRGAKTKSVSSPDTVADTRVQSYLQSGNLVVQHSAAVSVPTATSTLVAAIARKAGFAPPALAISGPDLAAVLANCPPAMRAAAEADHRTVHVFFFLDRLADDSDSASSPAAPTPLSARQAALQAACAPEERFELHEAPVSVLYLHTPKLFSGSQLAKAIDKLVPDRIPTSRNWRTVTALAEMVQAAGGQSA